MKKALKLIGIGLACLFGVIILAALGLYTKTRVQFNKTYDVQVELIAIPTDAESIEHGKHLAFILCAECRGEDLGGTPNWISLPGLAVVSPPNLTSGQGSVTAEFTDEDWVGVRLHGVKPDGHSVFVMRSMDYQYINGDDLGDILAYVKSAPPINRDDEDL